MKAWAIVWGPKNNGVEVNLRSGNKALAIFHSYSEAVKTLATFDSDADDYRIVEVEILQV